jgi:hypothetical protein
MKNQIHKSKWHSKTILALEIHSSCKFHSKIETVCFILGKTGVNFKKIDGAVERNYSWL